MGLKLSAFQIAKDNCEVAGKPKYALVTGASSGIGLATVLALAPNGWKVICCVRDVAKMEQAIKTSPAAVHNNIEIKHLDLASFASVKRFASELPPQLKIDALICNAGLFPFKWELTEDGNEMCFQTCHLSHHLLTSLLENRLQCGSRVVYVSSAVHTFFSGTEYEWPNDAKKARGFGADSAQTFTQLGAAMYAQAKLANIHQSLVLGKRLKDSGVMVFSVHPGAVDTGIWPWYMTWFNWFFMLSSDQGAAPTVHVATNKNVVDTYKVGMYFVPSRFRALPHEKETSVMARNEQVAHRLWAETEKIVRAYL